MGLDWLHLIRTLLSLTKRLCGELKPSSAGVKLPADVREVLVQVRAGGHCQTAWLDAPCAAVIVPACFATSLTRCADGCRCGLVSLWIRRQATTGHLLRVHQRAKRAGGSTATAARRVRVQGSDCQSHWVEGTVRSNADARRTVTCGGLIVVHFGHPA